MKVVLDTGIIIDILRGVDAARTYYLGLNAVPVCSEVTRIEILTGMRSAERTATRALLEALDWAPIDDVVARRAGAFGRQYRASHQGLGVADLVVAATATVHDIELATTNRKHFPMLNDVIVPYDG